MAAFPRIAILSIVTTLAALLHSPGVMASPINLVTNGDFSAGYSGFDSDYTRTLTDGWDPNTFTVTNDPGLWHPTFASIGDHTTGSGMMFVGNGSTTLGGRVWESDSIDVFDGQQYYFEAFVSNVCCTDFIRDHGQSVLDFRIAFNGGPWQSLGVRETDTLLPGLWNGLSTEWIAPSAGSVSLRLINLSSAYDANDFAMDDVYFGGESTVTPEPATLLLILGGLPLARAAQRRRAARERQSSQAKA